MLLLVAATTVHLLSSYEDWNDHHHQDHLGAAPAVGDVRNAAAVNNKKRSIEHLQSLSSVLVKEEEKKSTATSSSSSTTTTTTKTRSLLKVPPSTSTNTNGNDRADVTVGNDSPPKPLVVEAPSSLIYDGGGTILQTWLYDFVYKTLEGNLTLALELLEDVGELEPISSYQ